MIQDERRAYVRARLVALAEEVMMVSSPRPTEAQLRQHALDRAVTDGVTALVHTTLFTASGVAASPEEMASAITKVADVFVEYLRSSEEEAPEPTLDRATVHQLLTELANRAAILKGSLSFSHEGEMLAKYTDDMAGGLDTRVLAFRRKVDA